MIFARKLLVLLSGSALTLLAGCNNGGGSSLFNNLEPLPGSDQGPGSPDFVVTSVLPQDGQTWQVNRAITITFNKNVNPATVSAASVAITPVNVGSQIGTGQPALGTYSVVNGTKVVFQPTCPTSAWVGGLLPGNIESQIRVPSSQAAGATTRASTGGEALTSGTLVKFTTPAIGPGQFFDPKVNQAPQLVSASVTSTNAAGQPVTTPFAFDPLNPIPPNKFVGPPVYFTLMFDQPVSPDPNNISSQ